MTEDQLQRIEAAVDKTLGKLKRPKIRYMSCPGIEAKTLGDATYIRISGNVCAVAGGFDKATLFYDKVGDILVEDGFSLNLVLQDNPSLPGYGDYAVTVLPAEEGSDLVRQEQSRKAPGRPVMGLLPTF